MDDFSAFTDGERTLLAALGRRGVRFMLVGLSAAVLQGANTATRDIDIWFEDTSDLQIGEAVREAHGIWVSGFFGMRPPQIAHHRKQSSRRTKEGSRRHSRVGRGAGGLERHRRRGRRLTDGDPARARVSEGSPCCLAGTSFRSFGRRRLPAPALRSVPSARERVHPSRDVVDGGGIYVSGLLVF